MRLHIRSLVAVVGLLVCCVAVGADPFVLVVMDPLSKPLACDCVRGYAQRDYDLLAAHLEQNLDRPVKVVWFESLAKALEETDGQADLVVGKHSVVLADAKSTGQALKPIMRLTDKKGSVTQTGLIVVRKADQAKQLSDLTGYRILFGPEEAEEKSSAAEAVLRADGVDLPEKRECHGACSEATTALMELPSDVNAAAVISSYAQPLLEGCGSIKKGDLRVVGETRPVPFVTAFVNKGLDSKTEQQVTLALVMVTTKAELLIGLETLVGFVPWKQADADAQVAKKKRKLSDP